MGAELAKRAQHEAHQVYLFVWLAIVSTISCRLSPQPFPSPLHRRNSGLGSTRNLLDNFMYFVIDWLLQDLDSRFSETASLLLIHFRILMLWKLVLLLSVATATVINCFHFLSYNILISTSVAEMSIYFTICALIWIEGNIEAFHEIYLVCIITIFVYLFHMFQHI
ncbi:hypothetical protein ACJX0J_024845, partial [Zea mays]